MAPVQIKWCFIGFPSLFLADLLLFRYFSVCTCIKMKAVAVVLIILIALGLSIASAQSSYPIDYTTAVTSQPASITANTDIGTCVCDLTAGGCDPNCCCDLDCTVAQRLVFSGCKPEGPTSATSVLTCAALARVNANLTYVTVSSLVGGGLCVTKVNSTWHAFRYSITLQRANFHGFEGPAVSQFFSVPSDVTDNAVRTRPHWLWSVGL
jgi:hypothetical protein